MNDNLSFYFCLSQLIASIMNAFQSILAALSKDALILLLLFSYAAFLLVQVFRYQTKGRAPYNLWFIKVPPWIVPSVICLVFSALLLLHPPC